MPILFQAEQLQSKDYKMIRAAITFFVIGLLAFILGANNIGGLSIEIGKLVLFVFVVLAAISILATALTGRKSGTLKL
jgi:uncharacterized membrane protein YtjA (UPF0391 family)